MAALDQLLPIVEKELYRIAKRAMRGERAQHTLQPTALVNEAYLRLVDLKAVSFRNRSHFFALSARLMRRILVDFARAKRYQKRGGGAPLVSLDEGLVAAPEREHDIIAVDEALQALADLDPRRSQVVELRFFGGLTVDETAEVVGVSAQTVMRDWILAKAWLLRELRSPSNHEP